MTDFKREYSEPFFNHRMVREFEYDGDTWRFPAVLAGRYEVKKLFAVGGFGVLLEGRDKRIFDRRVLIKSALPDAVHVNTRNNLALGEHVDTITKRVMFERKALLHAHLRGVSGVPILIDWCSDISPLLYGPHQDGEGGEFVHEDPCVNEMEYLVISYFEGIQLDDYCKKKPQRVTDDPEKYLRYIGRYLANILHRLHRRERFGDNTLFLVYQDLKPANILVSPLQQQCCLIDSGGVAFCFPKGAINYGIYTQGFGPPEVEKMDPDEVWQVVTPQWDIYTLGATLKNCFQLLEAKISPGFQKILDTCMADDPTHRYNSMEEVAKAL